MSFVRKIENFTCEHCGTPVIGDGFTNHCPQCLWSKHVDNDPGDRGAVCGGMLKPVGLEGSTPKYFIVHECEKCHTIRRISVNDADSESAILALVRAQADRESGLAR